MNQESILSYVKLYQDILNKQQIFLSDRDLDNIYNLILLVFKLDDLYDLPKLYPPSQVELANIKQAMISLMPDRSPIGLRAIASIFQAMQAESLLIANPTFNLNDYLRISSQSIGSQIITAYLASKIKISSDIWYSNILVSLNYEVNILVRLANDFLDENIDRTRSINEVPQTKAIDFFASKSQFKKYFFYKYIVHKLHYYFCLIRFKYLKLSDNNGEYMQAIACSESVLEWAFKVYVIDRNSCQ